MATPALSTFFLLLISSPLTHARDSQFFSKVTTTAQTPIQTVALPNEDKEQQSLVDANQETEQPDFVPQNENGYGLYGHETGLNAPETEAPSTYNTEKYYNNDKDGVFKEERLGNGDGETFDTALSDTEKDDLLNFDDAFDNSKYGKGETFSSNNNNGVGTEHYTTESLKENTADKTDRFGSQVGQTETEPQSYYKDNRFDNRFTDELNSRYKAYRGEPNAERKGMSDTRFVENGKYNYDLEKEQNSRYDTRRWNTYNNRGYESNDEVVGNTQYGGVSYDNSGADKYEFNTMEEYEKSRLNQYDP